MSKINWIIEKYDCVESTLDIVKEKASLGVEEGLVVYADEQTQGRGRHGNSWIAPKGNLYMSLLLRPHCTPAEAGQYSFVMAVALSKAIDEFMDEEHEKHLKWPNDVLLNGKKCAGILLETELSPSGEVEELHVGVGVNILTPPEDKICVQDVSSQDLSVDLFLECFVNKIDQYIDLYKNSDFNYIVSEWVSQAYRLGERINVRLPHERLEGVFDGLDKDGTLLLRLDNGTQQRITAGEVYFEG